MQDGVIEFARHLQRPEAGPLPDHAVDIGRRGCVRRLDRNGCDALGAIDIDADKSITDAAVVDAAAERAKRNASSVAVALRGRGELLAALGDPGLQLAVRNDFIDQPQLHRALTLDALLDGAEVVSVVTAHLALVDYAGEPPGSRQHRQQRYFRQRYRSRAVVGKDDVIGRQRQLVTT